MLVAELQRQAHLYTARVFELVRMDEQRFPPVLLLDFILRRIDAQVEDIVRATSSSTEASGLSMDTDDIVGRSSAYLSLKDLSTRSTCTGRKQ